MVYRNEELDWDSFLGGVTLTAIYGKGTEGLRPATVRQFERLAELRSNCFSIWAC